VKHFYAVSDIAVECGLKGKRYLEFLRIPAMSAGLYVLAAGEKDPQSPHREDEMYYVVRGRSQLEA
jgi:mannose-6-phosphate isomerase-like protein (cupin superfamily)